MEEDYFLSLFLFNVSSQKLSPEHYFLGNKLIHKCHVREYENELKREFKAWADEGQLSKVQKNHKEFHLCMYML